jgi:glycosyltransferase involved in cell wall biosynthesis
MSDKYPHATLEGKDIVIIGLQAWYTDIGSNCKSIAQELSLSNRVLYINMPLDRRTILRKKNDPNIRQHRNIIKNKKDDLIQVQKNLWNYYPHKVLESINWIPSTAIFSFFNRINNRRFASDIKKAIERLGFRDYILFNDNDIFRSFYLKELLKPRLYIYYSRDNLLGVDYWRKHGRRIEPEHIAKADIALANSTYLANYQRQYNSNSYYVGQGCNISLFTPDIAHTLPADMKNISHPIIGYVGAITILRLDPAIIQSIAASHPDWNIVLVGPEDEFFLKSELHACTNIHFPGKKAIADLPSYISSFDVCINPQLINELTIGNYPLKIDEYLAMGKPVVATRTDALQIFEGLVYIAGKPEDYPGLIDLALSQNNDLLRKKRTGMARTHTWENSVKLIASAIDQTLSGR